MVGPPAVSVVIPTKDRPGMAAVAVSCAAAQRDVEAEVIVVDDGSSESNARRLATMVGDRATIVRHERGLGVSRARNAGIERARAPWVAFLDDDDLWAPRKLAAQLAAAGPRRTSLVHTGIVRIDEARKVLGAMPPVPDGELLVTLVTHNPITTPSCVLADVALVRDAGGFDPRLSILADWDLWLSLARSGTVAACPSLLTAYTEHDASMSVTRQDELQAELDVMSAKHADLLAVHGGTLGGPRFERWIAASVRRSGRSRRAARLYAETALRHRDPGSMARAAALALGPAPLAAARTLRRQRRPVPPAEVAWLAEAPVATPVA